MKTPGMILQEKREEKGYSKQLIARETNISLQYISAMEEDLFDQFSSESYLLGYLKAYADYLDIPKDYILTLYKNCKLAEAPVPLQELIGKQKPRMPVKAFLVVLLLMGLGTGLWFGINGVRKRFSNRTKVDQKTESMGGTVHVVVEEPYKGVLYLNDILEVATEEKTYHISPVKILDTKVEFKQVCLNQANEKSSFYLKLGEEKYCSLNNVNFLLRVVDFGLEEGKAICVEAQKSPVVASNKVENAPIVISQKESIAKNTVASSVSKRQTILSLPSPVRINISITFTGNTNFRYFLDNRETEERYYQSGDTLQRNMMTNFRLWTSNAGKTRLKVSTRDVVLGRDGEIVVKVLRWVYNARTNVYDLILEDYA